MGKRMKLFKQINIILADVTLALTKFKKLQATTKDAIIHNALNDYILIVAYINYMFMIYLMQKVPNNTKKDIIDNEFKRMMEREFGNNGDTKK